MRIRSLDTNHDFTFGKGRQNFLQDQLGILENIQTRLLEFFGDCFFNIEAGIDWWRYLGSPATKEEIALACRAVILKSYGVVRINSISVGSVVNRKLIISYNIDSIFSSNYGTSMEVTNA